jgi:hypothetical protein
MDNDWRAVVRGADKEEVQRCWQALGAATTATGSCNRTESKGPQPQDRAQTCRRGLHRRRYSFPIPLD